MVSGQVEQPLRVHPPVPLAASGEASDIRADRPGRPLSHLHLLYALRIRLDQARGQGVLQVKETWRETKARVSE